MLAALAAVLAMMAGLATADCVEGNCTGTVISFDIGAFFPFFDPVNNDSDSVSDLSDDTIEPLSPLDDSSPEDNVLSFNVMEVFAFDDDSSSSDELNRPGVQFIFHSKTTLGDWGVLDLSGMNLTGEEVTQELRRRELIQQPVYSLVLSNSRIHGLSASTFQPVEDTLSELHMDNCSVSLSAFSRLSGLRVWNLSNNGLVVFERYPLLRDTLEVLDLSHNKMVEVRPEISVLQALRELNLSYNWIKSVSEYPLALLPHLEVVSFTMNSLEKAMLTTHKHLVQVDLDWNYLRMLGDDVQLPSYHLAVKLASNPWSCDCNIIEAKSNYDVLDIDILKCATFTSYELCYDDSCPRVFLPEEDGDTVADLTKESIHYRGCSGLTDQWHLFRQGLTNLREHEPEKLLRLELLLLLAVFMVISCLLLRKKSRKKFDRQSWLKIQQIPYLKIDQLKKPQEVPYIKIDTPDN